MAQSLGLGSDRPRGIEREPARGGVKRRVGAPAANGGQAGRYSVQLKRRDRHRSGWGSNRGWRLRDTTMQLGGHGEGREVVTANQLGMPPDESRAPGEGHQQNQGDRRQTLVGDPFSLSGSVAAFGAVAASMEEALLESPMRGEIHPAVVLLFPAVVAEAADDRSGKGLGRQPGDPKPFLIGRLGGSILPADSRCAPRPLRSGRRGPAPGGRASGAGLRYPRYPRM